MKIPPSFTNVKLAGGTLEWEDFQVKKLSNYLRLLIGLGLFTFLIYRVGPDRFYLTFTTTKILYVFLSMAVLVSVMFLNALSFKILLDPYAPNMPFFRLMKYLLYSVAVGIFFPANTGQFSLVYFLKKENISIGTGTAVILLNKIGNILLCGTLALSSFSLFFSKKDTLRLSTLFLFGCISVCFLLFTPKGINLFKKLLGNYAKIFTGFSNTISTYFKKYKVNLLLSLFVILVSWGVIALGILMAFFAFGISCPFWKILFINCMVTIIAFIPISVAGLGIREASAVFLYHQIGLPEASVLSAQLLIFCINYLFIGIIFIFLVRERFEFNFKNIIEKIKSSGGQDD